LQLLEVELRAKIDRVNLLNNKILLNKEYLEIDMYYRYAPEINKDWVVRIRRHLNDFFVTYKSNKKFGEGAWSEVEMQINKEVADKLHDFFLSNKFILDVIIEKNRKNFQYKNFEINIDQIKDLGIFIEAEVITDNVEEGRERILELFLELDIPSKDITEKGYVTLMKEALNGKSTR